MIIVWSGDEMGKHICCLRKKQKLSQKALAKMAGISVYRIRLMEAGTITEADAKVFAALCNALNVEMEVLTRYGIKAE